MYNNGTLYGALQNGEHRFFETYKGEEKAGSIAKFSHLWLKEGDQWTGLAFRLWIHSACMPSVARQLEVRHPNGQKF